MGNATPLVPSAWASVGSVPCLSHIVTTPRTRPERACPHRLLTTASHGSNRACACGDLAVEGVPECCAQGLKPEGNATPLVPSAWPSVGSVPFHSCIIPTPRTRPERACPHRLPLVLVYTVALSDVSDPSFWPHTNALDHVCTAAVANRGASQLWPRCPRLLATLPTWPLALKRASISSCTVRAGLGSRGGDQIWHRSVRRLGAGI